VIGTNKQADPGLEAELDVQYIMGMNPNTPTWFISVPANDFWTDLITWTGILSNTSGIPYVHSVSYGDQYESQPSSAYKFKLESQVQMLTSTGLTIIFASGDSGTGCDHCTKFQPSFPATIPFVTSVGATQFISGNSGPEEAVTFFPSGGGFSNHFTAPTWQTAAIAQYFKVAQNLPKPTYYNASGRGTPDVSALGQGFQIMVDGKITEVAGTSCSAPTFASIVALLNQARFAMGKGSFGFMNPWIYQVAAANPTAFFDVTQGTNVDGCCHIGFSCAVGWDPVTGVGTPNYEVLKTLI